MSAVAAVCKQQHRFLWVSTFIFWMSRAERRPCCAILGSTSRSSTSHRRRNSLNDICAHRQCTVRCVGMHARTDDYLWMSSSAYEVLAVRFRVEKARHELRHAAEQVVDHGQHLVAAGDLLGEHVEALEQVLVRLPAAQLRLDALEELQLLGQVAARQVRVLLCVVSAQISVRGVALL